MSQTLNQYIAPINTTCENFIYNSTSYGLNVILTNFIEEIRQMKYKNDLLIKNQADFYTSLTNILDVYYSKKVQQNVKRNYFIFKTF